ncbi:hypothetical protein CGGC5_v011009 [Colletotrichum fructicola Nara gc5]|uniref:VWFA domain-containing protein n=1 Tax=Colletotrichum fructicola (strain Nara gc5) TaxID=1213859 RepID=A0A7J6IV08_COLFN|nr:hypothetical protein CGGC5_v011009 [Colletotrichum fructicola Nara gc5]
MLRKEVEDSAPERFPGRTHLPVPVGISRKYVENVANRNPAITLGREDEGTNPNGIYYAGKVHSRKSLRTSNFPIGCLLDVSASMREALETDGFDERATDRLSAVLRAALKLAQSERRHSPDAIVFIGIFGLDTDNEYPPAIDLCEVTSALLGPSGEHRSGHDLLIARADAEGVPHVKKYILGKLTENEARVVDAHLERHQDKIEDFVDAIPVEEEIRMAKEKVKGEVAYGGAAAGLACGGLMGAAIGAGIGLLAGKLAADKGEDREVENSEALKLARRMCKEWLKDFTNLTPRPVVEVVRLLERLLERQEAEDETANPTLLNTLRQYMYGRTPMRHALDLSLEIFKGHPEIKDRVLVVISDGFSTDGDPMPVARSLQDANVSIASIYLTSDAEAAQRSLHYQAADSWHHGQRLLFNMASRVAGVAHPIPALASMGWSIPSAGEVALHATVSTSAALNEICSLLLSARLGTANLLLDVAGRFKLDAYINDQNIRGQQNPSDQGHESTCYAHAAAAVICMAMSRISGREGGYDDIGIVRQRILKEYTTGPSEQNAKDLFEDAARWYRLRLLEVDEDAARQAVLRRRPVLATFHLSREGWGVFCGHFKQPEDGPNEPEDGSTESEDWSTEPEDESTESEPVLKRAQMMEHRSLPSYGGHAVVLVDCKPDRLTFLNSWGKDWGTNGSFSVEDHTVLELDGCPMRFYDVYWLLADLTPMERQAHSSEIDAEVSRLAKQYPGIFDLKLRCPHCGADTPLSGFVSNADSIRRVQCVKCPRTFTPEPEYLRD